jgi:hypothetical protein
VFVRRRSRTGVVLRRGAGAGGAGAGAGFFRAAPVDENPPEVAEYSPDVIVGNASRRVRDAVVRYPHLSFDTHGQEYFYQMLLLHVPPDHVLR